MAIYRRGTIYWCDIRTAGGKRVKRSLRTADRTAAQELHDKLKHELWKVEKLGERQARLWDEAALRWLEEKEGKRTIADDASKIMALGPYLSGRYLHELTADEIQTAVKKITPGHAFQNRHLALIRSILRRAMAHWQWIERVPALVLQREPKRRVRFLTRTEADRLLGELPGHLRDMVEFSLHTGLRQANVTQLRWANVDMVRRMVIVNSDEFKNGNDHSVPLNDIAAEVIRRNIGRHDTYVFTYEGSPVTQCNTTAFRAALARAGITNFRWHDLRHTWASWLVQSGVPLQALQELGGWESPDMVRRYAHLSRAHLAEYVGRLEGTKSPTVDPIMKTG